jgi:hypothetical protein
VRALRILPRSFPSWGLTPHRDPASLLADTLGIALVLLATRALALAARVVAPDQPQDVTA